MWGGGGAVATFEKRGAKWRARLADRSESASFATKAQAQAWATMRERELADVAAGGVPRKTMRQALERYAAEVSPTKRGERWETVRIRAWIGDPGADGTRPAARMPFVDLDLAAITTPVLAAWRDARLAVVSPASVLREMNLLGAVLETARREWHWLRVNPLRDVRRPRQPEARRRRLLASEIDALCLALGWDGGPVGTLSQEVAAAMLLAIETAMRQGELLGLTWARVDVARRVAHLPRTKNESARDVPLSVRALEILALLRGRDAAQVFTVSSGSCDALFRKAKGRAGIEDLHFHDTRREATSRLASKVDVLTLARITGHKDLKMLMVYYQTDMSTVAGLLG
jgi:integrase